MPETAAITPTPTRQPDDPSALRIVLFGMPDAGKSSLLGALVQAAHSQERALQGKLSDYPNGMADLWRRVYDDRPKETLEEIVPYPVLYEPAAKGSGLPSKVKAILYDCDGRIANDLLAQHLKLDRDSKQGSLARAVLDADALILAIDASAGQEQIDIDFREFGIFLGVLEAHREHRREIGGLPVFLALSKCDLLAREAVSRGEWEQRVALRRRQVKESFAEFLDANAPGTLPGFGTVELRISPTAVKWPNLKDLPAKPREPVGVAELFRDSIRAAYGFRNRAVRSDHRLRWTVGIVSGFLAMAAAVAIIMFVTGGPEVKIGGLADMVAKFEARDKPLPDRLTGDLQKRLEELNELRDHPEFDKLPMNRKTYILDRIEEVHAYQKLRDELRILPIPERARDLRDLKEIEDLLAANPVPAKFAEEWDKAPPPLEIDRRRRLEECQTLREGVAEMQAFYATLRNKAKAQLFEPEFHIRWIEKVDSTLAFEKTPPFKREDGLKGIAYEFKERKEALNEWMAVRHRLENLRDMGLALGLVSDQDASAAVLVVPALPADADLNAFCKIRWEELQKQYPSYATWTLDSLPDPLKEDVRKRLKRSLDQLNRDSRKMILAKFRQIRPTGDDTHADWKEIATSILTPPLQDWRALLGFVTKLLDPLAEDPATSTAKFLNKESFELQIKSVSLTIPNNIAQGPFTPEDDLRVIQQFQSGGKNTMVLRLDKAATVTGAVNKKYRFNIEKGEGKLLCKPGDAISAELGLLKGSKAWQFTWSSSRTVAYTFESLNREPFLKTAESAERGSLADDVTITVDVALPVIPEMLPEVRREKK
ncbi:MAG: hypothetical protein K8T89_17115 [Planctomycetes bacterium]|nr:hypothetical protein [Planctomycetota bacterium]